MLFLKCRPFLRSEGRKQNLTKLKLTVKWRWALSLMDWCRSTQGRVRHITGPWEKMCVPVIIIGAFLVPERWKQMNWDCKWEAIAWRGYLWICLQKATSSKILGTKREGPDFAKDSLSGVALGTCPIAQVSSEVQPAVYGTEWKAQKYFVKMQDTFVKVPSRVSGMS